MNLYTTHPWHSIELKNNDNSYNAFVEICPNDGLKYELCKKTGLLKVDRPQKYSNSCPCLYGFLPQTLSDEESSLYCSKKTNIKNLKGDSDPLDICVFTNFKANNGIIVKTKIIGGLRLIDGGEVDDKIIAVLCDDPVYGKINDIKQFDKDLLEILKHYFLTYKGVKGTKIHKKVKIVEHYGKKEAIKIISLAELDYKNKFNS